MKRFVLDASTALSWCFEDERAPLLPTALVDRVPGALAGDVLQASAFALPEATAV